MDDISEWMLWMIWISKSEKRMRWLVLNHPQKKEVIHQVGHVSICVFSASSPSWSTCWEVPKLHHWSLIATTKELSARYWKLFLYAWFSIDLKSSLKKTVSSQHVSFTDSLTWEERSNPMLRGWRFTAYVHLDLRFISADVHRGHNEQ